MLTLRALPPLLPFPFPPSRLLASAELCSWCLGPLPCHCIIHFRLSAPARGTSTVLAGWRWWPRQC